MPDTPRRFLCFPIDIPSKFFPVVLYAFFCLFSGFQLDLAVSMLVGYASSRGLLDKIKPSLATLQNMETNGVLASCARLAQFLLCEIINIIILTSCCYYYHYYCNYSLFFFMYNLALLVLF